MKEPCVYILASRRNGTLYIGVTSNIYDRIVEHRLGMFSGFTKRYNIHHLVYYETFELMDDAIRREKRLKEWQRGWKIRLIESMNPQWSNLFDDTTGVLKCGPADTSRGF